VSRARPRPAALTGALAGSPVTDSLLAAFALVLVVEGLLPLVAPRLWRESFRKLIELADGQLRFIGLASIAAGLLCFWLVQRA
jgi:uncharacterized protein YjeT (DUF2065 family)